MRPSTDPKYPPLPIIKDTSIIEENPDQTHFTSRFTQEAIRFMSEHSEQPFFVYLAHPMPHVPLYTSEPFKGSSESGLFGDVIQEIDASVGEIVKHLEENQLRDNTIINFHFGIMVLGCLTEIMLGLLPP